MPTKLDVNGKPVEVDVEPRMTLADCLRNVLRLTWSVSHNVRSGGSHSRHWPAAICASRNATVWPTSE